jgi:NAD(P)H-dependent FMN reductase
MSETDAIQTIRILGFAGSLRLGSYNRAMLRAAQELAPEDMVIEIFDLTPASRSTMRMSRRKATQSL